MQLIGARLQIVKSEGGRMTAKLTRDMIDAARAIAADTTGFWTDQLNNADQVGAYHAMADEIWGQTEGRIDAFIQSVGTAGPSLRGNAEGLRRRREQIQIVAVEPAESPVSSGGLAVTRSMGLVPGFVVPLWRKDVVDQIARVSTEEAIAMAMRLAREEGLFAGMSTGANVTAALRVAEQLHPGATVVTVMCNTGMKSPFSTYGQLTP